ncbi:MAG: hypothetical protein J3Q66DRAFT_444992 [Benniella sp.]|nr:MAG: hypothetical protein J3Q66DRAFT_444992 [Benniella sp.]
MIPKLVGLSLLAALASTVNAYTWYAHILIAGNTTTYKIHPIDLQVPGNDAALVWEWEIGSDFVKPPFLQYGYVDIEPEIDNTDELLSLIDLTARPFLRFTCKKIEDFQGQLPTSTFTWWVYSCTNPNYYGKKGSPAPPKTTTTATPVATTTSSHVATTATCPVVTVTIPVTVATTNPPRTTTNPPKPTTTPPKSTTTPPKPSPTCLAGYKGKCNGKGPDGACCSNSDDCKDTCVKGICRDRCLTGFKGKRNGKGPNGACCSHSDDCKDTCVKGICGVHP